MDFQRRVLDAFAQGVWNFVVTALWDECRGDVAVFEERFIGYHGVHEYKDGCINPQCTLLDAVDFMLV
jgi:hypothetical protein